MADDDAPILKAEILVAPGAAGRDDTGSTQVDPEEERLSNKVIMPPLPPHLLAAWSDFAATRSGAIDAIVLNTVGLGLTLERDPDAPPADDEGEDLKSLHKEIAEIHAKLNALAQRDKRLGNPTFLELLKAVKRDEEECGTGYMEVSRNRLTGEIDGLYHAPGPRMRRKKLRDGWILQRQIGEGAIDTQNVEYYNFGDKVVYDDKGKATGELLPGKFWGMNEIIDFRVYTSKSRDYGLPRDASLAIEYLADKKAAEANSSFFDSSGAPPSIIFVQGVENRQGERITFTVAPETVRAIADTIRSDGGHQKRVAVVPVPPGTETNHVQLAQPQMRDVGYVEYRKAISLKTLATFRLSPIFLADIEGSGRYSAEVQRALTLEQVFDPEQTRWEGRLRHTILTDLGFGHRVLKLARLAVESDQARRQAAEQTAVTGSITNREYRRAHGFGPLPEVQEGDELVDGRKVVAKYVPPPAPPDEPLNPDEAAAAAISTTGAGSVSKADPVPVPAPAPKPAAEAPAPGVAPVVPPLDPAAAAEVQLEKVTPDDAARIGKVIAGWNDMLVTGTKQTANQPFGGASDGSQFPHPDQRGQAPGVGGRQEQGAGGIAKGHGVDHVETELASLRDELEGLSNDAVDRALARTRTLARGIAAELQDAQGNKLAEISVG